MPTLAQLASSQKPWSGDQGWSATQFASPLAALQQYLDGVGGQGIDMGLGNGSEQAQTARANNGESYQVTPWDKGDGAYAQTGINNMLELAKKYDPNASIEYYNAGDSDSYNPMARIAMDQSLLPAKSGNTLLSNLVTANNQTPDAGQGPKVFNSDLVWNDPNWGPTTIAKNIKPEAEKWTDVGKWGPLVTSAIIGGAGMGMLPGFGGMTDAAAQGLVSGATGSLPSGSGSFLGLSGSKLPTAFQSLGKQLGSGNQSSFLSALLPYLTSMAGLPSYASSLGKIALSQLANGKGGGGG